MNEYFIEYSCEHSGTYKGRSGKLNISTVENSIKKEIIEGAKASFAVRNIIDKTKGFRLINIQKL